MENHLKITPATVLTSDLLTQLCEEYHEVICSGERPSCLPRIRVRYVEDRDKFGYAEFGDFFFFADDLYVWRDEERFADDHCKDVVEGFFDEKCTRTSYAVRFLYAGADTNYVDSNGEPIFVGDVIEINDGDAETEFALSHFNNVDYRENQYCFMLDNHSLSLEECVGRPHRRLTRVGTVYYQLDMNMTIEGLEEKIREFNGWHDTTEVHNKKVLMARFTPNFDQEQWKYEALDLLGAEFNWKK